MHHTVSIITTGIGIRRFVVSHVVVFITLLTRNQDKYILGVVLMMVLWEGLSDLTFYNNKLSI